MGDRVFTDVVMANRMRGGIGFSNMIRTFTDHKTETIGRGTEPYQLNGPLAIWTTRIWQKEAMGMRWLERKLVEVVKRWTEDAKSDDPDTAQFVREVVEAEPLRCTMTGLLKRINRTR